MEALLRVVVDTNTLLRGLVSDVSAAAKVEGDTVVVACPQVSEPVAVRYAWADDPVANLVNQTGLPAGPFRSDQPHYNQ